MRILMACLWVGLSCSLVEADEKTPRVLMPWGTVFDLDGDCEFLSVNGKLTINVPATCHDLNKRNGDLNAPRVLREVEGDFDIQVKLTGKFDPGPDTTAPKSISFVSGGLLLWGDEKNYVRLERNRMESPSGRSACYPPLFEMCVAGKYSAKNPKSTTEKYFQGDSTWLWLERKGQRLRAAVSHDGDDWVFSEEVSKDLPDKLWIGVSAISTSSKPHSVTFEDLQITLPEKPEK